jgi:hypothetical protein
LQDLSALAAKVPVAIRGALYPRHIMLWYCLALRKALFRPGNASKQMAGFLITPAVLPSAFTVDLFVGSRDHQAESEQFSKELIALFSQLFYTFKG